MYEGSYEYYLKGLQKRKVVMDERGKARVEVAAKESSASEKKGSFFGKRIFGSKAKNDIKAEQSNKSAGAAVGENFHNLRKLSGNYHSYFFHAKIRIFLRPKFWFCIR